MFDVGWTELLLIGIVALIVVGPKDLPHLFHALGRFTAKARSMAREFSSAMDDAARNSGIEDASRSLNDLKSLTSKRSLGLDALDRAADRFEKWDPKVPQNTRRAEPDPAAPAAPPPAAAVPTPITTPVTPAAGTPPAAAAAVAVPAATAEEAEGSKRQLRAVRRSDMKDD